MKFFSGRHNRRIPTRHIELPTNNVLYERPKPVKTTRPLTQRERKCAIFMFCLAIVMYFIVNIQRVAVPGQIFDALQGELRLSASAVASLGTAFMYIYAATQLLVGLLVDKYGGMRVLASGSIVMLVGALLFPLAHSYWVLVAARMLVGLGCGATYLSVVKETDHLFPDNFAPVMGLCIFLGYLGGVVGTMPLAMACKILGWRPCLLVIGVAGLITLVGIGLFWPKVRQPESLPGRFSFKPHVQGFTNIYNLIELFSFTVDYGIYYAIITVLGKKFLEDVGGLPPAISSLGCTCLVFVPAILNQVTGLLTSWAGNRRRPFFVLMCAFPVIGCAIIVGSLLMPDFAGRGLILMLSFIIISLVAGFSPVTSTIARETNPSNATGTAIGIINFGAYISVAFIGTIAGWVLDFFGGSTAPDGSVIYPQSAYTTIFIIFLIVSVITFRIGLKLPETYGKNIFNNKPYRKFGLNLHT